MNGELQWNVDETVSQSCFFRNSAYTISEQISIFGIQLIKSKVIIYLLILFYFCVRVWEMSSCDPLQRTIMKILLHCSLILCRNVLLSFENLEKWAEDYLELTS